MVFLYRTHVSYQIRAAEQFAYLNLDRWNGVIGSAAQYWFMNSVAAEGSEELKFTIEKTSDTSNASRFLAATTYADNKPLYADKTEAAAWLLEPYTPTSYPYVIPETSTADGSKKYYRIVSSRAASDIYNNNFRGKYFQIDGETGSAAALNQTTYIGNDNFGAYWWVEATGEDGAVLIHNLVSDYTLKKAEGNVVKMSDGAGTPFYLVPITGETSPNGSHTINIPNTFAISMTKTVNGTDGTCLDQSRGAVAKVEWTPLSPEDKGDGDNGSAWYFELATDEEVAAATTAYIEAVRANYTTVANAVKDPVIATLNALSGVMDTEAAIAAIDAVDLGVGEFTATTIAEANAAMTAARSLTLPESTLSDEVRANMAASLVGNFVQIKSRLVADSGHNHPYVTVSGNGTDLHNRVSSNPIISIWEIVASDIEGKVCLRNVNANKYLKLHSELYNNNPIEESGDAFTVRYSIAQNGFGIDKGNSLNGDYLALHAAVDGNTGKTVRWDLLADNSWFDLVPVDGEVTVTTTKGDGEGEVVLNFGEGVTPNTGAAYSSEADKLIVSRVTPETPAERAVPVGTAIAANAITDGSVTLTGLTEGDYTITAPAGFFTVNGKLSAPIKASFNVAADGTTTGVDEIGVATSGKQVIYDLQGRRVQRASKGLYIINGVKTLVK